jgi:hypothetical protein
MNTSFHLLFTDKVRLLLKQQYPKSRSPKTDATLASGLFHNSSFKTFQFRIKKAGIS